MNAELLLCHFDRMADAPDAIPRLRQFILDLAVRGKLVPQDPNDESVSEYFHFTTKTGELFDGDDGNGEWEVPQKWTFLEIQSLASNSGLFVDGDWVESKDQDPSGNVRLIQLADVGVGEYRNRSSRFMNMQTAERLNCTFLKVGDILIARMPDPLGRACIFPGDPKPSVTVVDVAVLRVEGLPVDSRYIVHAINAPIFASNVALKAAGTTRSRISRGNLGRLKLPLPPLAEQQRIVAKVDELMALCDRLEAAQGERERRRDKLVAASLQRLNTPTDDAGTYRDHARFTFNHLPRLTTRIEHIKQLRQTILNLAVRGKLVPQNPNDEPASKLLECVEKEQQHLLKSGEIKRVESFDPIADDEMPFVIPKGWQVTRMGWLARKLGAGSTPLGGKSVYLDSGVPFLRSQNVYNDGLRLDDVAFISRSVHDKMSGTHVQKDDILLNITGASIGRCALVPDTFVEGNVSQHVAIIRLFLPLIPCSACGSFQC
jgi:type I restriction enzyme S subunit